MKNLGETFRALHVPGKPFILANAWDIGSAKMLTRLGAQALATSSAAHAFTLGMPDGTVDRDTALAHAQDIVAATNLPVQGDFENGYGEAPETCAETVRLAAEVGLAGICIEDTALPGAGYYDFDHAVERIRAAVAAARALPNDFVLTARADGMLTGSYGVDEAIRRLQAFEAAGADCLYAPMPGNYDDLKRVVAACTAPVNALVAGQCSQHSVDEYAALGMARLSLGSALARATHRLIHDAATGMFEQGDFAGLRPSISADIIDEMMG